MNLFYEGMAQDIESDIELDFNSDEELDDAISIMSDGVSDQSYEVIHGSGNKDIDI